MNKVHEAGAPGMPTLTVPNTSFLGRPRMRLDRRTFLKTSACAASVGTGLIWPGRSQAAEFTYKLGLSQPPTHPITQGLQAACADILRESKERLDIKVFPSSQLGRKT